MATSLQIHLISGNPHLRSLLTWHLQQAGYRLLQSTGAEQAKGKIAHNAPNLVILDTELSDGNALELCRWIQQKTSSLLLMLSTLGDETDIVSGLQAGADDYLSKPFGMQEFLARVEALTRRQRSTAPPASLQYGELEVDLIQRRVKLKTIPIELTPQEFSLLYVLVQALGLPLSRSEILERAWPNGIDNPRTVDTHILSLRKKLEVDPRQPSLIQTVRNVGYRFSMEVLEPSSEADVAAGAVKGSVQRSALMA